MSEVKEEIALEDLKMNFTPKWRVQQIKNNKAVCIPYADSRKVQEVFDVVCSPERWQSKHHEVKGNLFCEIGLKIGDEWIWKSDVGKESNIEKEKGESSDSFKRAAVMWGVGRFLYEMKPYILPTTKKNGKEYPYYKERDCPLYDGETLSKYINWKLEKVQK